MTVFLESNLESLVVWVRLHFGPINCSFVSFPSFPCFLLSSLEGFLPFCGPRVPCDLLSLQLLLFLVC